MFLWVNCEDNIKVNRSFTQGWRKKEAATGKRMWQRRAVGKIRWSYIVCTFWNNFLGEISSHSNLSYMDFFFSCLFFSRSVLYLKKDKTNKILRHVFCMFNLDCHTFYPYNPWENLGYKTVCYKISFSGSPDSRIRTYGDLQNVLVSFRTFFCTWEVSLTLILDTNGINIVNWFLLIEHIQPYLSLSNGHSTLFIQEYLCNRSYFPVTIGKSPATNFQQHRSWL